MTAAAKIWHVSEDGGIARFEPRMPPTPHETVTCPVVWAVDDLRLPNYLLPRDCPRVTFHRRADSSAEDCARLLGPHGARHVVAIEEVWLERACTTPLWLYELPPQTFRCADENAGYWVSDVAVIPLDRVLVADPLAQSRAGGAEIRVVPSLWPLQDAVVLSTLGFSGIRMRNAARR